MFSLRNLPSVYYRFYLTGFLRKEKLGRVSNKPFLDRHMKDTFLLSRHQPNHIWVERDVEPSWGDLTTSPVLAGPHSTLDHFWPRLLGRNHSLAQMAVLVFQPPELENSPNGPEKPEKMGTVLKVSVTHFWTSRRVFPPAEEILHFFQLVQMRMWKVKTFVDCSESYLTEICKWNIKSPWNVRSFLGFGP